MNSVAQVETNMNYPMNAVMSATMAIQRDMVCMVTGPVTKMTTNMKHQMKVVMPVAMAIQRDGVTMVDSVAMMVVMPVTIAIQRDKISTMMSSVAKVETNTNNLMNVEMSATM